MCRAQILDNVALWLDRYHVDGLRLDAVHALVDDSDSHLLADIADLAHDLGERTGRPRWVTAECDVQDTRYLRPRSLGGHGLDALWADDLHHCLHTVLTGERQGYYAPYGTPDQVAAVLAEPWLRTGTAIDGQPGRAFVVCDQNHDQIGNRARGDRLAALAGPGAAMAALTLTVCSPYVPLLFMGEEWAASTPWPFFADPSDPELARAITEGRRREFEPFGWDPADVPDPVDPATAASAVLQWAERSTEPHAAVLAHASALLALRAAHPDLGAGDPRAVTATVQPGPVVVLRRGGVVVAAHLGAGPAHVEVGAATLLLGSPGTALEGSTITFDGPGGVLVEPVASA